jgi:hypothetical protein
MKIPKYLDRLGILIRATNSAQVRRFRLKHFQNFIDVMAFGHDEDLISRFD